MLYRTEGIVIRNMPYGEGNAIITILTNTHGKAGIMVRGAKKLKSRHGSLAQPFTHGEFTFFRKSGLGTLNHGEIITSHHKLRERLELSTYAAYAAELCDRALQDDEAGAYVFEQLRACFAALEEGKDPRITLHLFETKIIQLAGYTPEMDRCIHCGSEEGPFAFSYRLGGILCRRCRGVDPTALQTGDGALKLLRLFTRLDLRRLGAIQVSDSTRSELRACIRSMMDAHLPLKLKSRDFLDQMEPLLAPDSGGDSSDQNLDSSPG
ncbi:DNA repair protein RecO [Paenibacillus sp. 598K]|uniref:DNA repair protein RecO n=1 Tax=Paenibacillus sp. 598K TaxID=1117987 RepID=UPI000FFAACCD|nr:DNA repair protein RecO [Paenibacillus sp. 598K]GBF75430.1 DNA repair protein RecO [Paenibacillus sp. 598K]